MLDTNIQSVHGREIIDSRGNPTVEVDVTLAGGAFGRAAAVSYTHLTLPTTPYV